jgi:putative transposase
VVRGLSHLGYSERRACEAIGLDRSTYLRHKFHRPSNREIRHVLLEDAIREIHARSRGTYGMLRITAALEIEQGIIVNKKLVWKLMQRMGLKGLPGPKKGRKNLVNLATAEDLVERVFEATGPNELWLTDITEHPTSEGKVYCCCVLDMFSRRVLGWAIDRHADTYLVKAAITMAAETRPNATSAVLHSDHGSQFTSWAFTQKLYELGIVPSMGTIGDCYDNAPMESFWGTMQIELFNRQRWRTVIELSLAIANYIDPFYNNERRHSALNYLTPNEFEALHSIQLTQAKLP